jgi:hypothetical protein
VSAEVRSACKTLNRERTRGLLEAGQQTSPGESVSIDVWSASFARGAEEWDVPIVGLEGRGLIHDKDGFITSEFLTPLTPGAEAEPYLDAEEQVVYNTRNRAIRWRSPSTSDHFLC